MKSIVLHFKTQYQSLSLFQKIIFIFLVLLYIVFPQMILIPICIFLVFKMLYIVNGYSNKIFGLFVMISVFAVGIAIFLGFLLLTGADTLSDDYVYTDIPLSNQANNVYENMIDELAFYEVNPLYIGDTQTFEMMVLVGYTRGFWLNREPVDYPRVLISPFSLNATYSDLDIFIYNQFGRELRYFSFKSSFNSIKGEDIDEDVTSIIIQIKDPNQNVLYDSGEIDIYHNRLENPNEISFGGQYDPTPLRTWILNALGAHIAGISVYMMLYYLSKKFKLNTKVNLEGA